jgi:predicted aconitase with swiveling domain
MADIDKNSGAIIENESALNGEQIDGFVDCRNNHELKF